MICFRVKGIRPICHQRVLPLLLLLLLLLSATLVDGQQTVTADEVEEELEEVEEVEEEETTTLLPEQHEVAFGFIYSKEFRVRTKQT